MRLTAVGKGAAAAAVAAAALAAGVAGASVTRVGDPHPRWHCVVVRRGDTLWALARRTSARDPRAVVREIAARNGLASGLILPGRRLWVPGEGKEAGHGCG